MYTRTRPDPITAAFVSAITGNTLATPAYLTEVRPSTVGRRVATSMVNRLISRRGACL